MAEYNYRKNLAKRRRSRRIKRTKILLLTLSVMMLVGSCILLVLQVHELEVRMVDMAARIEQLSNTTMEQQRQLQVLMSGIGVQENVTGQNAEWQEPLKPEANVQEVSASAGDLSGAEDKVLENQEAVAEQEDEWADYHKVYLTFDDGPSANTSKILEVLEKYNIKATFFVVGKEEESSKEAMRKIVEAGHTIGLHSYSHDYDAIYRSVEDFAADFRRQQEYVYQITGQKSLVYRFPGGSSNLVSDIDMQEFIEYLHSENVEYYDWNTSVGDGGATLLDVDTLVSNATKGVATRGTTIILMHDSPEKPTTLEALPVIIEKIQAMKDTVFLPITEDTLPVHHLDE